MDVTVVVATYGSDEWAARAQTALASVPAVVPTVHYHGASLAQARNACVELVSTEWVIHLDADDHLEEPGYIEALAAGSADLRAPAVRYVRDGRRQQPYVPKVAGHRHECQADCLRDGNWLVIGSAVRTEMVRAVGGWREWPVYEDWDLFQRCWLAGATVEAIPNAIYQASVRPDSRNRGPSIEEKNRVHHEIVAANFGAEAA